MFTDEKIRVIRSRRKTTVIEFLPNGELLIRAPLYATNYELRRFIREHEAWIAKKREKLRKAEAEAGGFAVLSEEAVFQYKCDDYYHPECEGGIAWDDEDLNIMWPLFDKEIMLSEKDKKRQTYHEYLSNRSRRATR